MPERVTCTRRLQFCAGHRVVHHESKCANLHGHNYVVYLTAESNPPVPLTEEAVNEVLREAVMVPALPTTEPGLDALGRVIDFAILKERIGGWIEREWDHGMILWERDPLVELLLQVEVKTRVVDAPPIENVPLGRHRVGEGPFPDDPEHNPSRGVFTHDPPRSRQKLYQLDANPTAENMALHLLESIGPLLLKGTGVQLCKVVLHETENCSAEATL